MTDEEFDSILNRVSRREEDTGPMAEGLDLALGAVGEREKAVTGTIPEGQTSQSVGGEGEVQSEEKEPEPVDPQVEAGDDRMQVEEEGPTVETQVPEAVAPPVLKPQPVKRQLILKKGPITEKPKPTRVSQRCLGKWTASKAKTNTAENPVEIASEEEQATPKKAESEPVQATDQEEAGVSPVQNEPGTETEGMAEGPDLASGSVSPRESEHVKDPAPGETTLTAQEEEAQYQRARKRKGKAPIQKKSVTKKPRVANTGIVIAEASQRTPPSRGERSDSEYAASEESDSDSGISLENEEYGEQSLPDDHRELVHPPVERLRYKRWTVELTDDVVAEMKLFDSKKLQSAYRTMNDKSKKLKCGKVLHLPSLDELEARESFLALLHVLGFEWLLGNENLNVPVELAKEFFATFRFKVTTDLDVESISFRVFGGEIRMSLIEWTVRLGICSLEEAIGPEWRDRERGIPRRHVEFEPQLAWEELTHPGAGQFQSTISRSIHLSDPILRLVQLFLDFNLLGQSNSAVRTSMTELYLMWCAKKGRKLHLGFWIAYQCHLIATHPARNLSLCHILGVFVRNNITVSEGEDLSPLTMVDAPGLFDTPLFVRTNTVYLRQGVPHFYAMGEEALPTGRVAAAQEVSEQEQRHERMEKSMEEVRAENQQLKAEVVRLASVVERILKGSAEQIMMSQRHATMEAIVSNLGEENYRMQKEMNRMLSVIDNILEEVTHQRKVEATGVRGSVAQDTGPSGHGGQDDETHLPETVIEEPAKEDDDRDGTEEDQPEEQPAPPAPRRSRRLR